MSGRFSTVRFNNELFTEQFYPSHKGL